MDKYEDLKNYLQNEKIDSASFNEIADFLLNKYVIRVGDKKYRLLEIEFYLYSSSHPDLITYPRVDKEGGNWFFHQSGVDICFQSSCVPASKDNKYCLDKANNFGGILIRSIIELDKDMNYKSDSKSDPKPVHGPIKCMDALFKTFGALKGNREINQIPFIDFCHLEEETVMQTQRYIPIKNTAENKIKSILKNKYEDESISSATELIKKAAEFIKKDTPYKYRYYIEPKIKLLWKNYQAIPRNGTPIS